MKCIHEKLDTTPMILFAELEPWERDQLEALCPKHCRIVTSPERLEAISDDTASGDVTIFSPFIHSAISRETRAECGSSCPAVRLVRTKSSGG